MGFFGKILLIIVSLLIWYYLMILRPRQKIKNFKKLLISKGYSTENFENNPHLLASKIMGEHKYEIHTGTFFKNGMSHRVRFYTLKIFSHLQVEDFAIMKKPLISLPVSKGLQKLYVENIFGKKLSKDKSEGELNIYYNEQFPKNIKKILDKLNISIADIVYFSKEGFSKTFVRYESDSPSLEWLDQADLEFEKINSILKKTK